MALRPHLRAPISMSHLELLSSVVTSTKTIKRILTFRSRSECRLNSSLTKQNQKFSEMPSSWAEKFTIIMSKWSLGCTNLTSSLCTPSSLIGSLAQRTRARSSFTATYTKFMIRARKKAMAEAQKRLVSSKLLRSHMRQAVSRRNRSWLLLSSRSLPSRAPKQ